MIAGSSNKSPDKGQQKNEIVLVTQSFANEREYRRAIFMIWSYWAHCSNSSKVILYTDNPDYFKAYFVDQPIEYVLLTPERISIMRGKIDFLHRMKIALIEDAFHKVSHNLMYADSDTFFIGDPSMLREPDESTSYMHLREYRFDTLYQMPAPAGTVFHKFVDFIKDRTFVGPSGSAIPVSTLHFSWNAGVIILHTSHQQLLAEVYALTDEFYPSTSNHACEQYAFSIVLQNHTQVAACDSVVYHYWHRVKKRIMDSFLADRLNAKWSDLNVDAKIQMLVHWTEMLPMYLEQHVLSLRDNAIQSFNEDRYSDAYAYALKAIVKSPMDVKFFKDVLYHTKRYLGGGKG